MDFAAGEVTPGTEQVTATLHVALDCKETLVRAHTDSFLAVPVTVGGSEYVAAGGNPVANLPTDGCKTGQSTATADLPYTIGVLSSAPAHRALPFNATAHLAADATAPALAPESTQTVPLSIKAKAIVLVTILQLPQAIHLQSANQSFAATFANKGNTPVHVTVGPVYSSSLVNTASQQVDLGVATIPGSGPTSKELTFVVDAPHKGKLADFTAQLLMTAHPIEGGAADQQVRADLFFRNEIPVPKSSPGSPLVLVGLALLGCAWVRRRA